MTAQSPGDRSPRDEEFDALVASFLDAAQAGRAPDRAALLAAHPDLATQLEAFFADYDRLRPFHGIAALGRDDSTLSHAPVDPRPAERGDPATSADETTTSANPSALTRGGLPRGTRVRYFGDFELLEELGRGGMGVVFRARQISLNRPVAIKMIAAADLADLDELRRFQNEAEAIAGLDHPHIVPIYEVGEYQGDQYFSMKLMERGSLSQHVKTPADDVRAAARMVAAVARAVHHAHQRGILHRDLKPANILLDAEGQPHVADFGLAKRIAADSGLTRTGAIMGTPSYMSPEQASGRRAAVTTASDVYGLGAILYALLAGRPPFQGYTVLETLEKLRELAPDLPRRLNSRVSRDLETICLKCLEKEPRRRYGSAEAMAEDLERFVAGQPIQARRTTAVERVVKWARRRPAIAGLLGLLAFSVAIGFGAVVWQLGKTEEARGNLAASNNSLTKANHELTATNESLEDQLYGNRFALAAEFFAAFPDRVGSAGPLLEDCPRRPRGWEWNFLNRTQHLSPPPLARPLDLDLVAFHPDGRRIATAAVLDRFIQIRDDRTGVVLRKLDLPPEAFPTRSGDPGDRRLNGLDFSPDGRLLVASFHSSDVATASQGGNALVVLVWDVTSGKLRHTFKGHSEPSIAFRPDSLRLAVANYPLGIEIWDLETGHSVARFGEGTLFFPVFSPDGRHLACHQKNPTSIFATIAIVDAQAGKVVHSLDGSELGKQVTTEMNGKAFSPDGRRLATANSDGVGVWDVQTGRLIERLKGDEQYTVVVSFHPDGRRLASLGLRSSDLASTYELRIWDLTSGRVLLTLPSDAPQANLEAWSLRFSDDGHRLISRWAGFFIKGKGGAQVWDATPVARTAGPCVATLRGPFIGVSFSPDGRRLAIQEGALPLNKKQGVRVVEVPRITAPLEDPPPKRPGFRSTCHSTQGNMAFSPSGRRLYAIQDRGARADNIVLFDPESGRPVDGLKEMRQDVRTFQLSPDGLRLATCGGVGLIRIWDATTGDPVDVIGSHEQPVQWLAYSPDGTRLASASADWVKCWDIAAGRERFELLGGGFRGMAFSPDGTVLVTTGRQIEFWDARNGARIRALPAGSPFLSYASTAYGHDRPPTGGQDRTASRVAYSPDGELIAEGSQSTVRVWHASTGLELRIFRGHTLDITDLAFSPDGRLLASCAGEGPSSAQGEKPSDGEVMFWDLTPSPAELDRLAWSLTTAADPHVRDPARAITLARRAVAASPENDAYRVTLGVALGRAGDWDGCIAALEREHPLRGGFEHLALALAYARRGDVRRGRDCYDRAAPNVDRSLTSEEGLGAFQSEVASLLGVAARPTRQDDEARSKEAGLAGSLYNRGMAFLDIGRRDQAIEAFERAKDIEKRLLRLPYNPRYAFEPSMLSRLYYQIGELHRLQHRPDVTVALYEEAREFLLSLIRESPAVGWGSSRERVLKDVLLDLGIARREAGRKAGALDAFREALTPIEASPTEGSSYSASIQSQLAKAHAWIGLLHLEGDRVDEALESTRRAESILEKLLPKGDSSISVDEVDALYSLACVMAQHVAIIGHGRAETTSAEQAERRGFTDRARVALERALSNDRRRYLRTKSIDYTLRYLKLYPLMLMDLLFPADPFRHQEASRD
jgi:WD40 repeat protein/tetratricopeptide (TPR) repeat protein